MHIRGVHTFVIMAPNKKRILHGDRYAHIQVNINIQQQNQTTLMSPEKRNILYALF